MTLVVDLGVKDFGDFVFDVNWWWWIFGVERDGADVVGLEHGDVEHRVD